MLVIRNLNLINAQSWTYHICIDEVLFCVFMDETESESINMQNRTRPISSHFDITNLVNNGFIIESSTLSPQVANHSAGFG